MSREERLATLEWLAGAMRSPDLDVGPVNDMTIWVRALERGSALGVDVNVDFAAAAVTVGLACQPWPATGSEFALADPDLQERLVDAVRRALAALAA